MLKPSPVNSMLKPSPVNSILKPSPVNSMLKPSPVKSSPKWESPLLKSNFHKTTFLPPQMNLGIIQPSITSSTKSLCNSSVITVDDLPGADLPGEANRYQIFISEANPYSPLAL